ncbi:F-box protein At3g54460-like isoform X3 [Cucurbita moschata]|uniref:F-box protein At3g54460-like isoform X3 n=1 Tax=Cucurbita moschata TaxID=3662 RepID=A0A6J1G0F2_CUCMO|nr:F-box protein At3g54460-like isoform X3 [Cucurbita moschata]
MDDHDFSDYKLCGFLCVVLAVPSLPSELANALRPGTRCYVSDESSDVYFTSENGVVLSPIEVNPKPLSKGGVSRQDSEQCGGTVGGDGTGSMETGDFTPKQEVSGRGSRSSRKKRTNRMGMVNGSMSAVHQIHALVVHKCLKIDAQVIFVDIGVYEEARVVLLVDVHLPIELWSGWQFPRSKTVAGALFRHLSCEWQERSSILVGEDYLRDADMVRKSVWNLAECHVHNCKLHTSSEGSPNKRLFELHEIFRSLPSIVKSSKSDHTRMKPEDDHTQSGIWDISDDILINILKALYPLDLIRVASTCRHLKSLAASIMPCMKLKLYPHQQAAVEWMLHRERDVEVFYHPLYVPFSAEDGLSFHINTVTGEIVTGGAPAISDFRGGLFCDEPGLGKTITALSLILKTQGTIAEPPAGVKIIWCTHNGNRKCGYYEVSSKNNSSSNHCLVKEAMDFSSLKGFENLAFHTPKRARLTALVERHTATNDLCAGNDLRSPSSADYAKDVHMVRCTRSLSTVKRNLLFTYEGVSSLSKEPNTGKKSTRTWTRKFAAGTKRDDVSNGFTSKFEVPGMTAADKLEYKDTWVQCDACHKWRKLAETSASDASAAWFCSMNTDPFYQSCSVPEESYDQCRPITNIPGFYRKETSGGEEKNISFFTSVLKENSALINSGTKRALNWLSSLTAEKVSEMERTGLRSPILTSSVVPGGDARGFHQIFEAFGLVRKMEKGTIRWYYPHNLHNLAFDVAALRSALSAPLDSVRLYLSRATLIVVPSNLVDHWKTQIQKHVRPGQLMVYVWTDHKKPSAHCLAWDYDVVITTFSILMQVHWHRVILDEGHTLGSSLNLTNKLQMAISLVSSNRWILTGTPTPNTPNSQLSHLQPLLRFLHEEAYGQNHKSWEAGILRPFEAEMEEGRLLLLNLLRRCMISARKADLLSIPPCIKKVTYLNFTEEHARTYNELVVTVRRNILMADWNDPSHVESLLNPKQWKFRSTTIKNIRLSCCVAGHIKVTEAGEDIQETMDILVDDGLDPMSQEYSFIKYNLLYGGNCARCGEWCRLPVIAPCRHLLCLDCVALDSEGCTFPGCGKLYVMQTLETLARPENPNPKWPVPIDLIELQPSYKQDDWDPDWQSTSSSKVAYLIQRLTALGEANDKIALIPPSSFPKHDTLLQEIDHSRNFASDHEVVREKVLIFSQFLEHIHVIEQQLAIAGIKFAGMYSPMHASNKMKSLTMFQHDSSCMALLMDGSAALGLDLSFVTHVFLMEPIWDRSMEEQVISRAHRMGAVRPIHVETLVMRETIEQQMVQFRQDTDEFQRLMKEDFDKLDYEGPRAHRSLHDFAGSNYLSQLKFVRTNPKIKKDVENI